MKEIFNPPTPTEYRGVKFKSKSEALFARCLDLANNDVVKIAWSYEPPFLKQPDGYIPDFEIWFIFNAREFYKTSPIGVRVVAEYKPAGVTDSYKKILAQRFDRYHQSDYWEGYTVLIEGSFFNGVESIGYSTLTEEGNGLFDAISPMTDYPFWFNDQILSDALEYRFDLLNY